METQILQWAIVVPMMVGAGLTGAFSMWAISIRKMSSKLDRTHFETVRTMCNENIQNRLDTINESIIKIEKHMLAIDSKLSEHRAILSKLAVKAELDIE